MRKYIYKFKNYTSVEVDNLHDLKEGDLALYEDKFLTRNNGKVEEVVKGSGSSSEDEYSTDYPDDFIVTKWASTTSFSKENFPMKVLIEKDQNTIFDNVPSVIGISRFTFRIPNIDTESIIVEYDLPEYGFLQSDNSKVDLSLLFKANPEPEYPFHEYISLDIRKYESYKRYSLMIKDSSGSWTDYSTIPLIIKFKTVDGKAYKVSISNFYIGGYGSNVYVNSSIPLKHFKINYKDLL